MVLISFFYPIEPLKSFIRYIVLDCLSINLITALSLQNKGALTTALSINLITALSLQNKGALTTALSINLITAPSLQNKGALTTAEAGTGGSKSTGPPSMADILKGLNTVKLRTVQR